MQTCLFSLKCSVSRRYTSYEINFFSVIPQRGNNLAQRYSFVSSYNGGSLGTENESNRIFKDGVVENTFQYFEFETWKMHFITFFPQSHKFREKGKDCDVMF